jgi:hypothetical protein
LELHKIRLLGLSDQEEALVLGQNLLRLIPAKSVANKVLNLINF